MKRIIGILLLAMACYGHSYGQENFFTILKTINAQLELPQQAKSIQEYDYLALDPENGTEYDTLVQWGDKTLALRLTGSKTTDFISPDTCIAKSYNQEGRLLATEEMVFRADGKMLAKKMDFGTSPAASFMNSVKTFEYDENGRVIRIAEKGETMLELTYLERGLPAKMKFDAGLAIFSIEASRQGDTIRYDITVAFDEDFMAMLGEKTSSEEYILGIYNHSCACNTFFSYRETEAGSQQFRQDAYIVLDTMGKILEEKDLDDNSQITRHLKYRFDEAGRQTATIDLLAGQTYRFEYDENGNVQTAFEKGRRIEYRYDERGNYLWKMAYWSLDAEGTGNLTRREITYW
jgi:YD repeat-containing protein